MPDAIPLRSGTWEEATLAIRARVAECETYNELGELFRSVVNKELLEQERGRIRVEQLARLAHGIASDPQAATVDKEARRADIRSGMVVGVCNGIAGLCHIEDPELIDQRLAFRQLGLARTLVIEDFESVFDFETMFESAKVFAIFMLERARAEQRFDDSRMALRAAQIVADGQSDGPLAWGEVALAVLVHLLTSGVVNEREIPERLFILQQIHDLLGPLVEKGSIKGPGVELVATAGEASRDTFAFATDFGPYHETVDRLNAAYEATGNPAYLDDLVLYCEAARPGESDEGAAFRLDDLALFLRRRALCLGKNTDLVEARQCQFRALELTLERHPRRRRYSTNMVACEYALIKVFGGSVFERLEELRRHLPALPVDAGEDDHPKDAAEACAMKAMIELAAASEHRDERAGSLLEAAILAAEEATRLFSVCSEAEDATDMALLANALKGLLSAHRDGVHVETGTESLVEALRRTRHHTRYAAQILGVTQWMLDLVPDSRDALIEALGDRYRAQPIGMESKWVFDYEVLRWHLFGVLKRGDIVAADKAGRAHATLLVQEMLEQAATCGSTDVARAISDGPLAWSGEIVSEAAVQLALAGDVDNAAHLAQISVAVRANDALLNRMRREGAELGALMLSQGEACASLVSIVGWETTIVLLRAPGGEWELAGELPSEPLTCLDRPDWAGEEHTAAGLVSLMHWLDELAPVLAEAMADPVIRAQGEDGEAPVLCLATGCLSHYPLSLLAAQRADVKLPLPTVAGVLADAAAEAVRRPVETSRCAFLAGAPTVPGSGVVDVDADRKAIATTGLQVEVIGDADATDEAGWPPPDGTEVLHYAGHLLPTGPDTTEMILANGTRIPTDEIRDCDLRSLRVTVLMCCHSSSVHLAVSGEQIQHLAGAFLEAGSSAVVASIWPAFDVPARLFTERFYAGLTAGDCVAACFADAVDAIRAHESDGMVPFAHPVYWAGFSLYVGGGSWIATASTD